MDLIIVQSLVWLGLILLLGKLEKGLFVVGSEDAATLGEHGGLLNAGSIIDAVIL